MNALVILLAVCAACAAAACWLLAFWAVWLLDFEEASELSSCDLLILAPPLNKWCCRWWWWCRLEEPDGPPVAAAITAAAADCCCRLSRSLFNWVCSCCSCRLVELAEAAARLTPVSCDKSSAIGSIWFDSVELNESIPLPPLEFGNKKSSKSLTKTKNSMVFTWHSS